MTALAVLLRNNIMPSLDELELRECGLNERELSHLSFAIQDGFASTLRRLDLSQNAIKSKGIQSIHRMLSAEFLPHLEILDLSLEARSNFFIYLSNSEVSNVSRNVFL